MDVVNVVVVVPVVVDEVFIMAVVVAVEDIVNFVVVDDEVFIMAVVVVIVDMGFAVVVVKAEI